LITGCAAFPLLSLAAMTVGVFLANRMARSNPEVTVLRECLSQLGHLDRQISRGRTERAPDRDALEVYVAARFRPVVTNVLLWRGLGVATTIMQPHRQLAERIMASRGMPTASEFAQASNTVQQIFRGSPDKTAAEALKQMDPPMFLLPMAYGVTVAFVVLPALLAALLFRGGALIYALGLVVVTRYGARAGRGRAAWRALLAWLPFLLIPAHAALLSPLLGATGAVAVACGLWLALVVVSASLPERGLQDRIAGTALVPR
jgi:hypothetical protein